MLARLVFAAALLGGFFMPAAAADLPDPELTPGVAVEMTLHQLCTTKWGRDARKVTAGMKRQVFASYGLSGNKDSADGCRPDKHGRWHEIDHLISRELGGADAVSNLWPQCYGGEWSASAKDRYENFLHRAVCAGKMSLKGAQQEIRNNWIEGYRSHPELPAPE